MKSEKADELLELAGYYKTFLMNSYQEARYGFPTTNSVDMNYFTICYHLSFPGIVINNCEIDWPFYLINNFFFIFVSHGNVSSFIFISQISIFLASKLITYFVPIFTWCHS